VEYLPRRLERTVSIQASPEIVFQFFTDSARWARRWGTGSTIDPRPGGKVLIRYPNDVKALEKCWRCGRPSASYLLTGYASGKMIGPRASLVTLRLEPDVAGTRLHLVHEFADAATRDHHVQGWR
jgi:hypothetical protein